MMGKPHLTPFLRRLNLFAWKPENGTNFGDELSVPIVEWVSGRRCRAVSGDEGNKLIAIGTLIEDWARDGDIIWGAGSRCIRPENVTGRRLDVRMVRGPLTRDYLIANGISCPKVYGDPAILLPLTYPLTLKPPRARKHELGVVLSILDSRPPLEIGHPIDVRRPWREIVSELCECRKIVSSSLHGIIVAESYGIPAVWLLPTREMAVKYRDYYLATGRTVEPAVSIEEAVQQAPPPLPEFDRAAMLRAFPRELMTARKRRCAH